MRLGSETVTTVDVRIIAATNKDLQKEVDSKNFRDDLFFRLKAVTLFIPPLRRRREDIPLLANYFIENYAKANNIPIPSISQEAMDLLFEYNWPGNIRELKNTVETAIALNRNGILDDITFSHLKTDWERIEGRNLPVSLKRSPEDLDREMIYRALFEIKKDLVELKQMMHSSKEILQDSGLIKVDEVVPMDTLEREAIKNAINFAKGNKRQAAKLLKISERTLYRKIKEYDL